LDEIDKKKAKKIKAMESDEDDDEGILYYNSNFTYLLNVNRLDSLLIIIKM